MYLTDVSIRRPAFSWVLSLILVVFGIFVFWKLPVRELPSGLQPPVVQVQVEYQSASAPIVDESVTQWWVGIESCPREVHVCVLLEASRSAELHPLPQK